MSSSKTLYRDPVTGKIAGVCAGLAEYFAMETWVVRILVVSTFFLLAGPFIVFAYIAAWFILEKKPKHLTQQSRHQMFSQKYNTDKDTQKSAGKNWHNSTEEEPEKVKVKSKVWQAGEFPSQALFDIKQRFDNNENRLRKVESYVTSSEFELNREINQL